MFNGFKTLYNYVYLYLDNNYEFASDVNTKDKKQTKIIDECSKYIKDHNLNINDKVYLVSKGIVIGYINKDKLKDIQ